MINLAELRKTISKITDGPAGETVSIDASLLRRLVSRPVFESIMAEKRESGHVAKIKKPKDWNEIMTEGSDFECPNCGDYMGKSKEVLASGTCGNCGEKYSNPGGSVIRQGNVEKFGRLEFRPEFEEGTTQGTLQTKDGKVLGSLIQYGQKWFDYDGGKWEAYCTAIKKRKKGFPDKQKAVEWIVRQTRATIKASMPIEESVSGLAEIPSWDDLDPMAEQAPVAEYQKRTRHADMPLRVWVYQNKGKFFVVQGDNDFTFKTIDKLSVWLDSNGYIDHMGITHVNL